MSSDAGRRLLSSAATLRCLHLQTAAMASRPPSRRVSRPSSGQRAAAGQAAGQAALCRLLREHLHSGPVSS